MAVIGTFGTYGTAILGIHAAQSAMQVTGNNIGNINTLGYTRQRVDQCSMYSVGSARYQNKYNMNIGYGAIVDNVSQLRDPYLDIRYRNDNSAMGYNEAMLNGLNQIAHILDEVGRGEDDFGMIEAKLGELKDALRDLVQFPDSTQHDDLVNAAASTICRLLNNAAKELSEIHKNEESRLMESTSEINGILNNIRDLNEQIRTHSIYGDNALELRDARNVQIDKLSKYMKLNVVYSMEKLDDGTEIEKLTISLHDTVDPYTGKPYVLVDGVYATQFQMPENTPKLNPEYNGNLDTSKMYWNALTKKPTHDIREARDWNAAYEELSKPYLDAEGKPTDVPSGANGPNKKNVAYYKYNVDEDIANEYKGMDPAAAREKYPDIVEIDGNLYTNNQNNAGILYNVAGTNPDAAKCYDPDAITSYKYLANKPADATVIGKQNGDNPDYFVMDSVDGDNNHTYYTNIWSNNPDELSYAIPSDNFVKESEDNLYLFTIDALKNKKGDVLQAGTDMESKPADLGDNDMFGALQAMRELLTEEAEFSSKEDLLRDPDAATKRGIRFYQHMLDSYAQQFAKIFNESNQIGSDPSAGVHLGDVYEMNGDNFITKDDPTKNVTLKDGTAFTYTDMKKLYAQIKNPTAINPDTNKPYYKDFPQNDAEYARYQEDIKTYQSYTEALRDNGKLTEKFDYYDGGILFSNNGNGDDPTGITAKNISVSNSWAKGAVRILNSTQPKPFKYNEDGSVSDELVDGKTLNDNLAHLMSVMDQKLDYFTTTTVRDAIPTNKPFFTGTFQEMHGRGPALLGKDGNTTTALYESFSITTLSLDNDRMSVSGVDLNEEATDMMKYSQAFSAACQLLTTIDSMLDRLINNTI